MGSALLGLGRVVAGEALAVETLAGGGKGQAPAMGAGATGWHGGQAAVDPARPADHTALAVRAPGPLATLHSDRPRNVVDLWRGVYRPPQNLPKPPQQGGSTPQELGTLVGEYGRVISTFFDAEGNINPEALLLFSMTGDISSLRRSFDNVPGWAGTLPDVVYMMKTQCYTKAAAQGAFALIIGYYIYPVFQSSMRLPDKLLLGLPMGVITLLFATVALCNVYRARNVQRFLSKIANIEDYYMNHARRFIPNMEKAISEILQVVSRLREHLEHNLAQLTHLSATDPMTITAKARYQTALERVRETEAYFTNLREQLPTLSDKLSGLIALVSATTLENLDPTRVVSEQTANALFGDLEPLARTAFELGLDMSEVRR